MYTESQQKAFFARSKDFLKNPAGVSDYKQLVEILNFHEWKYYVDNAPLISDYEYDMLYNQLRALETKAPEIVLSNSPTQRVSSDLSNQFDTIPHLTPMLSLANSYNLEDIQEFDTQIRKLTLTSDNEQIEYYVEPKLDGGSVALVYENDAYLRAATRGNGVEGENITANVKTIQSIPLNAAFSKYGLSRVELRGEAVMSKANFEKTNALRMASGLPLFANARNTASGGLRMKDPKETQQRLLDIFIFQMSFAVDEHGTDMLQTLGSHSKIIEILKSLGFKIPQLGKHKFDTVDQVFEACQNWEENRADYPYEIDGAVIKVDQIALQNKCGSTQHHPRWAIAFKFKAKQATSTLLSVEYQIGKTGAITPVAKVEPVALAGVTVSSISLHNEDFIRQKDIRLGDKVLIERAGDVIPYIAKPLEDIRTGNEKEILFPTHCPSCDTLLVRMEEQAAWRCTNPTCPEQMLQKMIYHVSKEAMNIDGLGKSQIEKFYELGWIKDISDIYNLDYVKIKSLEGFGDKSVTNLKASIEKAKLNPLHRLLNSLSIFQLGKKASKLIAAEVQDIFEIREFTEERLTDIKDIGPILAKNIIEYFADVHNVDMIRRMQSYGVNVNRTEQDLPKRLIEDGVFSGQTILFTGTLNQMSRKEAQSLAEAHGAKNISGVSSKLNVLVVGEKAGSKLTKAQKIGTVKILTEAEFLEQIGQ